MDVVLGDLAELGYDAEWEVLSAADVGAPHLRDRVWIVAYPTAGTPLSDAIIERPQGEREAGAATRAVDGSGDGRDPGWWAVEPDVGRVAHGVPARVDRLTALGNAIVPACAYLGPFRRILELEEAKAVQRSVATTAPAST